MKLEIATLTRSGGRAKNQDYAVHHVANDGAMFVVADGLGGHEGGEVASKIVSESMITRFLGTGVALTTEAIQSSIETAQQQLLHAKQTEPRYKDMCSTLSVLQFGVTAYSDGRAGLDAQWAHLGDTRIYHVRDGKIIRCTLDHSVPQALVKAGEITPEQIRHHEDRNRLLRALGMDGDVKPTISDVTASAEGDLWLLCTDGFWEYVLEREMEHLLTETRSNREWLLAMEQLLLSRAKDDHDNYTATAVRVTEVTSGALVQVGEASGEEVRKNAAVPAVTNRDSEQKGSIFQMWIGNKWAWPVLGVTIALILGANLFTLRSNNGDTAGEHASDMQIGDYVQFGKYDGKPITWRVIHEDGDGNPVLFSDKILTLKAFDAAGSYHTDSDRRTTGSNNYEQSNLRQWLNSAETSINWRQNPPDEANVWKGHNSYANQKGFLADGHFTGEERALIKPFQHRMLLTDIDQSQADGGSELHESKYDAPDKAVTNDDRAFYKNIIDKVFLLSVKQLNDWVYDRRTVLGESWYIGELSAEAVSNSTVKSANLQEGNAWHYWLNTPDARYSGQVRFVFPSGGVDFYFAYSGDGGVRPALQLDMAKAKFRTGSDGTLSAPYIVFED